MKAFFLDEPTYTEPEQSVKLVLKNNIVMRSIRQSAHVEANVNSVIWEQLDDLEKAILTYVGSRLKTTRSELEVYTGKAGRTITNRLNRLIKLNVIRRNGKKNDPTQDYQLVQHNLDAK